MFFEDEGHLAIVAALIARSCFIDFFLCRAILLMEQYAPLLQQFVAHSNTSRKGTDRYIPLQ